MSNFNWQKFWEEYRNVAAVSEKDLYFQVGKTKNGEPISEAVFHKMIEEICQNLSLKKNDHLLELCCGNGLLTYPIGQLIEKVYAFDFSAHLIETAEKLKNDRSIVYKIGDAKSDFLQLFDFEAIPSKFLMNDALAYFSPSDLHTMVSYLNDSTEDFLFFITNVPDDSRKWNFYDTEERKENYLTNLKSDETNSGLGRWWKREEILKIAQDLGLSISIKEQDPMVSNYRMDILFTKKTESKIT